MMKEYYLGLDIGTNSVGWAVTDENYELYKFHGKRMWGIRLFEQANTAADRRMKRANRRRLSRRKQRIDLLQELFAEEMYKIDPTFFIRLNESRLLVEDKSTDEKCPLFISKDYSDKEYYKEYPTIYHLRKELMTNPNPHDIRLVYLACHHILKNRGHFLIDGNLSDAKNLQVIVDKMEQVFCDQTGVTLSVNNMQEFEYVLQDKTLAKSAKAKKISEYLDCNYTGETEEIEDEKKLKTVKDQFCRLIVGNQGDIKKLFSKNFEDLKAVAFKFSDAKYDEEIFPDFMTKYPDYAHALEQMKAIYDWSVLNEILNGEDNLSSAKVKSYDKHKKDLSNLKHLLKNYMPEEYKEFFNSTEGKCNYGNYVGTVVKNGRTIPLKKCTEDDFFKGLSKIMAAFPIDKLDESDAKCYKSVSQDIANRTFLPLLRNKSNGVIPNQVHTQELKKILQNAQEYLPFLKTEDNYGTVADKILKLSVFRIPYYVGPLSTRHRDNGANAWIVRKDGKEQDRIYPWNFEDVVDLEKSNEEFINRMTNKCTYLLGEDVLPKNSLLYSRYMVLNELNNLKIRGNKVSVQLKQELYRELFCKKIKVTGKNLLDYLKKNDPSLELQDLSGFDENFKANLTPYLDFEKQIFGDKIACEENQMIAENIIKWKTIYGDDSKMLKQRINKVYPGVFNEDQLTKMCRFNYSGWGNFSEKFLNGIEGADRETGEVFTIIKALWETNNNLMQLLSKQFTFTEEIDALNAAQAGKIGKVTYENTVQDLIVSPANKRAIWQTVQIVEEVKKIMGCEPKRIFVEMARGEADEKNKKRTTSRKQKLLDLYAACEDDVRNWTKEIEGREEREFNSKKLYLYYTQKGRCMYTGETIDLDELMSANSKWDIDHIYPQSRIKDDSLDNMVLAKKSENAKKGNKLLSSEIRKRQYPMWSDLYQSEFISKKKYERLTRKNDFTDEELAGFIERQIVETRQSTKAVAELLKRINEKSQIVYVKAGLVSTFRHDHDDDPVFVKSRRVNDYHHAKDAYLNIVVGNVYNAKFTDNPGRWIKENRNTNYSIRRVFDFDVMRGTKIVWHGMKESSQSIATVKKVMGRNDILYTEPSYCDKGQLFNETLASKGKDNVIPLKKGLDAYKYGGYSSAKTCCFAFIEFDGKKNTRQKQIVDIPIYIANMAKQDVSVITDYLQESKGYQNVVMKKYPIKKNACIVVDGFPMRIRGANEKQLLLKNAVQLVIDKEFVGVIKKIEKFLEKGLNQDVEEKYDGFDDETLEELYDVLTNKFSETIYKGRPANQYKLLAGTKEIFKDLKLSEKAKVINEILNMLRCDATTTANLLLVGGTALSGNIAITKNKAGSVKLKLVCQSVTGLYEEREVLE